MRKLLLLFWWTATAFAGEAQFIYSASFTYWDYPKDLWPSYLVRLKGMGFNAIQVPARPPDRDLPEVLRLARQLGLRVWLQGDTVDPALAPFLAARGGPILDEPRGTGANWHPKDEPQRQLLNAPDFLMLRRIIHKQPILSSFDAGWAAGDDIRARPSDPSNYLLAFREALAAGAKAINCSAVLEGRTIGDREAAIAITGESRRHAAVFARNGALLRQWGRVLVGMKPVENGVRFVGQAGTPVLLQATPRGPAFISLLNYSEGRTLTGGLSLADPRTGKPMLVRGVTVPQREALLMPVNLSLAAPEVCSTCASFAPDERLVSATAELLSVSFENGVLAMEFVSPGEGELVLDLARQPRGPLVTGAKLRNFDWDDRLRRLSLRIPPGQAPDFRSRVGLGIDLPDTSVFLKAPPRLILGSTVLVTAVFSPPELSERSRLLGPPGWRVVAEPRPPAEIDYRVEIPADAIADDTVTLAVEAEGRVAQSLTLPLTPFCSLRIEPEEKLHLRGDVQLPIRPYLTTVVLPRRREYRLRLRNNYDEIRTFQLTASGEGLQFSPSQLEVPVGANLEREVTLYASPAVPRPGLYGWNLTVHDGSRKRELPLALAAISPDEPLAYQFDFDRDGAPEWVLENAKVRAVFAPHDGGRSTEFLLKEAGFNGFTRKGALDAQADMKARLLGPGQLELRSVDVVRRISLGASETYFEVEQTGGSDVWTVSTPRTDESAEVRFTVEAPNARVETSKKAFSTEIRLHFPDRAPRHARFQLEGRKSSRETR